MDIQTQCPTVVHSTCQPQALVSAVSTSGLSPALTKHAFEQEEARKQRKYVLWAINMELILEKDQCFRLEKNEVNTVSTEC